MARLLKVLTIAAFATTLCVTAANAADQQPSYDEYDRDHFGIFFDFPHYAPDKCAFDKKFGSYVSIKSSFVKYGGKVFKKIEASCKVPFYSYWSKSLDGFKCLYVDKGKKDGEEVLYAKDSSFEYYRKSSHGTLTCEFIQKIRYPDYPPHHPPPHPYPPHPYPPPPKY